ncbi:MAG: hypothetical protein K2P81_01385 [Bacteriovoracaceae bacterium]|nr:hypothetical protein [Bacteriovoracaceae bacterium]
MQSIISPTNWTYCRFESGDFRAFVSFGADPETLAAGHYLYFVTVTEGEEREIHQEEHTTLSSACEALNKRYADWNFVDQSAPKEGCSSCVAH